MKNQTTKKVNKRKMCLLWGLVLAIAGFSFFQTKPLVGGICFCAGVFLLVVSFRS